MANKQAADIKYYSEGYGKAYIQLSDEHTLWKVHTLDKQISDKEAEHTETADSESEEDLTRYALYSSLLDEAEKQDSRPAGHFF